MAGAITSMGLGSGTLNADVLDQLKKADEAKFVKPHERRLKENETRTSDLNTIRTLANDLKSISNSLIGETSYAEVDTKTYGNSVSIAAASGTTPQKFNIDVKQLATSHIEQSDMAFHGEGPLNLSGDLTFKVDGKEYKIELKKEWNLKNLKQAIFDGTEGKIVATSLKTGTGDMHSLVLKSSESGENSAFEIIDNSQAQKTPDDPSQTRPIGFKNIQKGQDAVFELDGVEIKRSSNTLKESDLIPGVTLTLTGEGRTAVEINEKTSNLVDNVEKFINKYNELIRSLNTVTSYDAETKSQGTFQGNNEMNTIKRDIQNMVLGSTKISVEGENKSVNVSLLDLGIEVKRGGEISFNKATLQKAIEKDYDKVKDVLRGTNKIEVINGEEVLIKEPGFFSNIDDTLDRLTARNGVFSNLENTLKTNDRTFQKELNSAQQKLNDKYAIMAQRFSAYDAMIAKMNAGFSSLQMIIMQSVAAK